jgi:thioredoxin 1
MSLEELDSVINSGTKVLVDFHAVGWCVPCRRLAPHFDSLRMRIQGVTFVKVDIDEVHKVKEKYGIMTVPTLHLFENGKFSREIYGRTTIQIERELASE